MTKFTILVAVYNAEQYLRVCLDSLIHQTLRDIQIVCIDDASTDHSLDILREYQRRDNRVEVLSLQENGGQAHARNIGLQRACGEYTCFCDSDDWLAEDALEQAWQVFQQNPQTDCVLFDCIYHFADGHEKKFPMEPFDCLSGQDAFAKTLLGWQIHGVYAIRTDLHRRFPYDESARFYSDDNTTRFHYLFSREVRCCKGKYFYRQHGDSVIHQISIRQYDLLTAQWSMKQQLLALHQPQELLNRFEEVRWLRIVDLYYFYFMHRREMTTEDNAYGLKMIKKYEQTIECHRLPTIYRYKLGYIPFRHFSLFRWEEEIYFRLRGLLGRNKKSDEFFHC
ncbi:MAG: glycosyltransferase family A protein [Prevotellaceae bacterium]|nr:glycosyltransferase family A protein [Prevotellaceae bacterium]